MPPAKSSSRPRFVFSASRSTFASQGIADPYPYRAAFNRNARNREANAPVFRNHADGFADGQRLSGVVGMAGRVCVGRFQ